MPPALAATGLGLLIALSGWLVLRAVGLSPWWLLLLPVVTAFLALLLETRRLRRALADAARQRDETAAQLAQDAALSAQAALLAGRLSGYA